MYTFKDLQDEVKRRATRDQGGTVFDTAIKNAINLSLFRIGRETPWRVMRRKSFFDTVTSYTTGGSNATATTSSVSVIFGGASLLTSDVHTGRYVKFSGSSRYYTLRSITDNTAGTIDMQFSAATTTGMSYEIFPQEEYNLPVQAGHRMMLWHEDYGYPCKVEYVTENDFVRMGFHRWDKGTPLRYRMWGEDMVKEQPKQAGRLSVFSTSAADTSIEVTIFGKVGGYPAYEVITTNGATAVTSSSLFSEVERVSKDATSAGRINVCADANTSTTVAVIPMGDTTAGILYRKVWLHPLPTRVFPINVYYYKDPYRLVNDDDIHELGQDFDEAIILLATTKIKAQSSQSEANTFYQMFIDELRTLRRVNADKIDWFPTLERPGMSSGEPRLRGGLLYRQVGSEYGPRSR